LRVVYPICCGVDVHKSFLVATLITTDGMVPTYRKKRFSTFNNSSLAFKQWLVGNNCFDVCMESTGKYYVLSTTCWRITSALPSPTLNGFPPSRATRTT
jgi:transposase